MSDLAQLRIWDDPAIRGALSWYLDVAENRRPAKFRIAESGHGWNAAPQESANAGPACGRKPRVPHRDGTYLSSDAGATHKATQRASFLACPINRQPTCLLTLLCPV